MDNGNRRVECHAILNLSSGGRHRSNLGDFHSIFTCVVNAVHSSIWQVSFRSCQCPTLRLRDVPVCRERGCLLQVRFNTGTPV
jgi:hypothetical protein